MKSGFSWSSVPTGAEIRRPQGRVGAGSQSCPVEEEEDGVEESDHSDCLVITLILLVYFLRGCAWTTVKCNVLIFPYYLGI